MNETPSKKEDSSESELMTFMQFRQENLERLARFRLMDDTFARTYFRNQPDLAEFVLRIITGFSDLVIDRSAYATQYDANRITGSRSLVLDVVTGDTIGRKYDFEVENNNASPVRAEIHIAAMISETLLKGSDFD